MIQQVVNGCPYSIMAKHSACWGINAWKRFVSNDRRAGNASFGNGCHNLSAVLLGHRFANRVYNEDSVPNAVRVARRELVFDHLR